MVPQFGIAKLVNISPITRGDYGVISIVYGDFNPTYNWGGHHLVMENPQSKMDDEQGYPHDLGNPHFRRF